MNELRFEDVLEKDGILYYTNVGNSMMPLIRQHRDIMTIVKRPEGKLKKYDAVLFKRGNQYVLHRILKVSNDCYGICGDNQYFIEKVRDEQIIGVLQSVVRNGKTVTVTDSGYKAYVHLWCDLYPVRFLILRIISIFRRIIGHIKRRLS